MEFFKGVALKPPDPIFGLQAVFQKDPRPNKVNLTIGIYKTSDLKTPVLSAVKKAEEQLLLTETNKEYLPILGDPIYRQQVGALLFGEALWRGISERTIVLQAPGGTGALRVGAELLKQEVGGVIATPFPTWPNHIGIFQRGELSIQPYPYYDLKENRLTLARACEALEKLPERSAALFHASCHNPTGADPTLEEWKALSGLCLKKGLIPFFDMAYQGFKRGLEEDPEAIRAFAQAGHEMLVALSFSKNFGLYSERVGALVVVTASKQSAAAVESQLSAIARTFYSNPPAHGAKIVSLILQDPLLRKEWEEELSEMRLRIHQMRTSLVDSLMAKAKKRDFSHLRHRFGMFCYSGLEKEEVKRLAEDYGIYLTLDGRMNVLGLNDENLGYVVDALAAVTGRGPL